MEAVRARVEMGEEWGQECPHSLFIRAWASGLFLGGAFGVGGAFPGGEFVGIAAVLVADDGVEGGLGSGTNAGFSRCEEFIRFIDRVIELTP